MGDDGSSPFSWEPSDETWALYDKVSWKPKPTLADQVAEGVKRGLRDGDSPAETRPAPKAGVGQPRSRSGKSYDAGVVAAVVRLAAGLNERPRRAVRERWFNDGVVAGATTSLIDHILDLMGDEPLSPARRRQWMREAREMLDDGSVTLGELTQRLM